MPHGFIEKVGRCVSQHHAPVGEVDGVRLWTAPEDLVRLILFQGAGRGKVFQPAVNQDEFPVSNLHFPVKWQGEKLLPDRIPLRLVKPEKVL